MKSSLLMALLLATAASAQQFELSETKKRIESPRQMFFEAKLSPYTPLLDRPFLSQPEAQRPYYAVFGGGPMLMGEIELDYQFFQKFGSLAGGISVGYAEKFGKAIDAASLEMGTPTRVDQTTGLRIIPIKALLVYRWDYAKEKWNVPLVPYVKGAFVAMPYFLLNGTDVELYGVQRGEGVKFGLAGVLGLALQMDFLDPRLARDFDSSVGVNHTYLFAEATFQEMNLFGKVTALDFSSQHFMFGLGFEF
jgi:hypothetical protein